MYYIILVLIMQDGDLMIIKNKGFALTETLIVSTVVSTILIYMFVQFNSLQNNYNNSFRYNDVDNLYRVNGIKNFIISLNDTARNMIVDAITTNSFIDISKVEDNYTNIDFLDNQNNLLANLDVKTLIITKADIKSVDTSAFSSNMQKMIKKIDNKNANYRLIVEFSNNDLATMTFNMEAL